MLDFGWFCCWDGLLLGVERFWFSGAMSSVILPVVPSEVVESLVEVAPGVELRVLRSGSGPALVLLPGWTCSADFFVHQLTALSDRFEVIAVDPRGHGGSSKPIEGNTFTQRGADLARLLQVLELDQVVLLGWSFGVLDVLAYLRDHGTARVAKLVLADETPKVPSDPADPAEWGEAVLSHDGIVAFLQAMINGRREFWTEYAVYMLGLPEDTPADDPTIARIVELGFQTPDHVAVATGADGLTSDFSATAAQVAAELPTLFVAREDWAEDGRRWLEANLPDARFATMAVHMGFATDPASFNDLIRDFAG